MRLARKHELHRTLRIVDHGGNLFDVSQNQIGAFVGGKTPREADGERVGTEHAFELLQDVAWFVAPGGLFDCAAADKFDHPRLQAKVRLPELAVVDVFDAIPNFSFAAAEVPSRAEMFVVETEHLRGEPGRNV